jgi:hypothetical protein
LSITDSSITLVCKQQAEIEELLSRDLTTLQLGSLKDNGAESKAQV